MTLTPTRLLAYYLRATTYSICPAAPSHGWACSLIRCPAHAIQNPARLPRCPLYTLALLLLSLLHCTTCTRVPRPRSHSPPPLALASSSRRPFQPSEAAPLAPHPSSSSQSHAPCTQSLRRAVGPAESPSEPPARSTVGLRARRRASSAAARLSGEPRALL